MTYFMIKSSLKINWGKMKPYHTMFVIYGIVLSIIYGVITSGQVLGFLGAYRSGASILAVLAFAVLGAFLHFRENSKGLRNDGGARKGNSSIPWLDAALYLSGVLLLFFLIALPMLRFPYSPAGRELTWDAGAYHFPKAVELYRSGSAWDLSIPYGDYPFGYESLLAFCLTLTGDESLFGSVHLLAALYFVWTFWALSRRFSRLPSSFLFLLACLVLSAGIAAGEGKPVLISGYALTIGKNDFILAAALLSVILHSPVGAHRDYKPSYPADIQGNFQPLSLGMASMIALSIKPNAAGIVLAAWLYAAFQTLRASRLRHSLRPWLGMLFMGLLALPGILWAVRNIAVLGVIFTPAAAALQADSILSNLRNPNLYALNFQFLLLAGALLLSAWAWLASSRIKSLAPSIAAALTLLLLSFASTPASAFQGDRSVPAHLAWRFGSALMAWCALVLLLTFDAPLAGLFQWLERQGSRLQLAAAGAVCAVCTLVLWRGWWITAYEPQNSWILRDQFDHPVGVDGYWSAYDYVQKNIRNSIIHIENGLAYYLYAPGYTNTPTKLQYPLEMADRVPQPMPGYFVIFRRDWITNDGSGEFPASLDGEAWKQKWTLIYADSEGRVYKRSAD